MSYGDLIKRSFNLVARRPYLWLLGFLAGGATVFNFSSGGPNYGRPGASGAYKEPSSAAVQSFVSANWEWMVGILAVLLVVGIVLFILGCIATGGIVRAAVEHDAKREYRLVTAWRAGYSTGWRIAGLRLLTFVLAILPGLLVGSLVLGTIVGIVSSAPGAAVGF